MLTIKDMQAGETYQVQVKQYTGLDSYTLSIGHQKETVDVTGYTVVKDSIEFKDQRNVYLFTPSITGRYRFEISDLTKGSDHEVNLLVYNSGGGEEASTSYGNSVRGKRLNPSTLTDLGLADTWKFDRRNHHEQRTSWPSGGSAGAD